MNKQTERSADVVCRFKCIGGNLPVADLCKKLAEHWSLWGEITARQTTPGSAHKDTECIFIRWDIDQSVRAAFFGMDTVDYPAAKVLMPEAGALVQHALQMLGLNPQKADLGRVIITKLKPGGRITPHRDEGPYADRYDRFHVVLDSPGPCPFYVDGESFEPQTGELWWFNHKRQHWVENRTDKDRVHLIIDVEAPVYRQMRGVTFQRERAHELWNEAYPLFEEHYHEIAHYKDIPLEVNVEAYIREEDGGALRCFTARLNGELVGYCVWFVRRNIRYAGSLQAVQDVLFVSPTFRKGRVGYGLIRFCERELRAEGVQPSYHHVKASEAIKRIVHEARKLNTPAAQLLDAMGYELIDLIYGKRLDWPERKAEREA